MRAGSDAVLPQTADCTEEFPELAAIADQLAGRRVILDGELVCLDAEGKPDFAALAKGLAGPAAAPAACRRRS